MTTIARTVRAVREALADERARARDRRTALEPEFLPAALAVIEEPVSPTSRLTAWVLLAGVAATLAWLTLGHVDIVASAQGRMVPTDEVKLVQAANVGVVRRIWVREGQEVARGQALVDLDPTMSKADEAQAEKALTAARLDVARNQAIADGLGGGPARFDPPPGVPADVVAVQRSLIRAQLAQTEAADAGLAAARRSSLADARAAADQVRSYDETVPVLDRELAAMNGLAAKGYAPGLRLLELQRQRRSEQASRDVASEQHDRGLADAAKFAQQASQTREQARQTALADLVKARNEVLLRQEDLAKARRRSGLQRLTAPVAGTVQQLAIHTLGGVVEAARPLMIVVPRGRLIAEVKLANREVGFVRRGQRALIKFDAFPYTRYGTLRGEVASVSATSIDEGKEGLVYSARVIVFPDDAHARLLTASVQPGMSLTADIRTGERTLASFLLSPVVELSSEAARER